MKILCVVLGLSWTGVCLAAQGQDTLAVFPEACVVPQATLDSLTERGRCWIRALGQRCTRNNACMVQCIASGQGRGVGGGCWHTCFAYRGLWIDSVGGLESCPEPEPLPAPPPPEVTCSPTPAGVATITAEVIGMPADTVLRIAAMAVEGGSQVYGTKLELTGVAPGEVVLDFRSLFYLPRRDTVSLGAGMHCHLRVALLSPPPDVDGF